MSVHALIVHALWGLLFTALPYTIARLWLKRIRLQRARYQSAERSVRLQMLADASLNARARGERFVPPAGWDA